MVAGQASYTTCNPESSRDAGQREEFLGRPVIRLPATLLCAEAVAHAGAMFIVDEATAEAIRIAFERNGELSAVAELRRHFPLITDNEGRETLCAHDRWLEAAAPAATLAHSRLS